MTRKISRTPVGDATEWSIRELKRFLKDRGLSVKHYKDRSILEEDVNVILEDELFDKQMHQAAVLLFLVCISAIMYGILSRYRRNFKKILCLNPLWVKWRLLEYILQALSMLNLVSVICSWILPPQWNLAQVYFWDHLLPDFGYVFKTKRTFYLSLFA